jgi:DNA-binding MarR family transcriptional regulator
MPDPKPLPEKLGKQGVYDIVKTMVETISAGDGPKGPMEVFLMAAISHGGLNTLYALQRAAGLQPGSLAPVIRNLVEAGLLVRSERGKRGRRTMTVTKAGERLLDGEWVNSLDAHREIESVLRGVTVALLMGDVAAAVGFLFRSADERARYQGPQELGKIPSGMAPVDFHADMRAVHENRRRAMEAAVLQEFGTKLVESAQNLDVN